MRKITVGGLDFQYKVGKTCVNIIRPCGCRVHPTLSEISGLPVSEVERGQHKRWFSVTPSMLREYIEKNLLTK
jgi:hypothetical protein